jgi:hypothetical protein
MYFKDRIFLMLDNINEELTYEEVESELNAGANKIYNSYINQALFDLMRDGVIEYTTNRTFILSK